MKLLIHDLELSESLIADRQAHGHDRYDEVWNGVYVMSPLANLEHQDLVMAISMAIATIWDLKGLGRTQPGANVSDRRDSWMENYRVPDVLCFTNDSPAENCQTHWCGGPEFVVEIGSRGERTTDKLDFYANMGTKEVLVVDRYPWKLTLYRVDEDSLTMRDVAHSGPDWITSDVVPLRFQLDLPAAKLRLADQSGALLREVSIETRA